MKAVNSSLVNLGSLAQVLVRWNRTHSFVSLRSGSHIHQPESCCYCCYRALKAWLIWPPAPVSASPRAQRSISPCCGVWASNHCLGKLPIRWAGSVLSLFVCLGTNGLVRACLFGWIPLKIVAHSSQVQTDYLSRTVEVISLSE